MSRLGNYNFIILGSDWDLYQCSYSDLRPFDNVKYVSTIKELLKWRYPFFRFHFSKYTNSFIKIPLKRLWNKRLCSSFKCYKDPICFICFGYWAHLMTEYGLADSIHNAFPGSRIVWFAQDLICLQTKLFSNDPIDIVKAKESFDLILSFDHSECKEYGLVYHPLVFSADAYSYHSVVPISDVYFLGKAKNRLKEILAVFEFLKQKGLVLDFYLVGVPESQRVYKDEIHYIDSMSYHENIEHLQHTKCVLEVMQRGGHGFTQRVVEAIGLNKKLLTNNPEIGDAPFFNPKYISRFTKSDDIDQSFLERLRDNEVVDYGYKDHFSPKELLSFIENKLEL